MELEEQAEFKNEYRDGEIIPMTGGTTGASHFFVCHCERNEVERSNLSNSCVSD
ncbi:hypothetical protein RintRC_4940 [Richelia intracellularis]|nr:hypothetical protein RintRC_4940 [Richelia intracellularis]